MIYWRQGSGLGVPVYWADGYIGDKRLYEITYIGHSDKYRVVCNKNLETVYGFVGLDDAKQWCEMHHATGAGDD